MAFTQFPNIQYFRTLETDTISRLGYFQLQDATELKHMMFTILQAGVIASPYQMRIKLFGNNLLTNSIAVSDWATISVATLSPTYTVNWLGNIYFDFAGNPLNPNVIYYMGVETSGYTRNGDTFYTGFNLDWYAPVNTQLSATEAAARFRILGNR